LFFDDNDFANPASCVGLHSLGGRFAILRVYTTPSDIEFACDITCDAFPSDVIIVRFGSFVFSFLYLSNE
jgi:hypothetical protein